MDFEYKGQKYQFDGIYRTPKLDDYYLSNSGTIMRCGAYTFPEADVRAIVTPIRKEWTFGGVVFEEDGTRPPRIGEWFYWDQMVLFAQYTRNNPRIILKPVRIE